MAVHATGTPALGSCLLHELQVCPHFPQQGALLSGNLSPGSGRRLRAGPPKVSGLNQSPLAPAVPTTASGSRLPLPVSTV